MEYPDHLLPKPHFVFIKWREELRQHYLLRSTPTPDIMDEDTQMVRAKYVNDGSREHLKDYSTNLLGIFTPADSAIQLENSDRKKYFSEPWSEAEVVETPTPEDFSVRSSSGCFYYSIDALHNFPQPFSISNIPGYIAQCSVEHTPTRSNFWHFSVRWKLDGNDVEECLSESQRKNLLGLVRAFLIEKAMRSTPENIQTQIAQDWYQVQTT